MSSKSRVIWNEGLFIKPQHFQQQQRYFESVIDERLNSVSLYLYGITELSLNLEYLSFGRIAIERAAGIMPDGTSFNIPQQDLLPDALEIIDSSLANQIIYLTIPLRSDSLSEVSWNDSIGITRYKSQREEVRDIQSLQGDSCLIDVSSTSIRLMLGKDDRSAYASIAIARILEKRPDGSVMLDDNFIPCHLNVKVVPRLQRFIGEMAGLMRERAKNIASRIGLSNQGGVADVADFMLLQMLNRTQPRLQHITHLRSVHPEALYQELTSICGELATFTDESRMTAEFASYDHDMPEQTFMTVMSMLRQALSIVLEPRAVSIQLHKRKYGLMVASIQDTNLVVDAEFILAVRARMPQDELRKLFMQQTKIASVEKIRELISLQLPGVPLSPLPVAPRQLPYHAGYTYFQLDKTSTAWEMFINSSGFAFHVAGDFPDLDLQFWAIRS
ncbi:type VI secretion system baseplate subunit TssK [Photobacterium kishitanii]|uniref:type VI secretion system baseplate subunit TssK n=1 Tax=Photobacterium kishitanii TaxID=318456 RepID=UPI0005D3149E|nr:type VI secretion system baseplate subunit TssK [Photobacterium kishitanii]KJG10597.1 type VI secretion protein [Photobacterium kishitanii]PSV07918.1 type VI secretion system baseplate subunit TssK [Photobacterium kishitanii]PSV72896.1 type VI secretion system baseplate subunit TssK [Photobacterium kishitanii]